MILFVNLKSLDLIHRRIYEHGENNQFDSFVYTNNQYSNFFESYTYQTYKEIQNKKNMSTVNRKY